MAQERVRNGNASQRRGGASRSSGERKRAIIALLLLVAAILIFISLVSYDVKDEANADIRADDLLKVFANDPQAKAKADTAHNGLGLVGAILSDFLVKSTIGYSVFCLPLLLGLWGWNVLRAADLRKTVQITNYTLIGSLLLSASLGMVRLIVPDGGPGMEWSGVIGDFLASILAQLLGRTGGSVVLLAAMLVTLVLAVDLDLRQTAERIRGMVLRVMDWFERMREARAERQRQREEESEREEREAVRKAKTTVRVAVASDADADDDEEEEGDDVPPAPKPRPEPVIKRVDQPERPAALQRPADGVKPMSITVQQRELDEEESESPLPVQPVGVEEIEYVFPSVELLDAPKPGKEDVDEAELKANADLLRDTLAEFDVELESVSVTPGPVITLYELVPASGVKISRIVSLENDMALKLAAKGIRIMAPIPGKSAVGVEIPNSHRSLVTIRSVINSTPFRETGAALPLAMGKSIAGEVFTDDLSKMPHLLIAGSTGSGKSVGINTILASLLYRMHPSSLKLVIVDPKKIELAQYSKLKNHFLAISPDVDEEIITTPHNAVLALRGVEYEMEKRYDRLAAAGVRNIADYNERVKNGRLKSTDTMVHAKMPYLIVVIDELADLMITAAREVEEPIARLAQLARAVGIHLIVATQRPSVDVITGVIKANFPARVAYQVASKTDSRTILDMNGAEQLLGNGDMLYLASGSPKPVRLQNAYISPDEVDAIVDHISKQKGYATPFLLPSITEKKKNGEGGGGGERDELFEEAARLIVRHQQGSVSLLQRRLKVGYSRAARLVDELEAAGIVGPFDGSKAREVLVASEAELEVILHD